MMRMALVVAAIAACSRPALPNREVGERFISIDADSIATAGAIAGDHMQLLETNGRIAVLAIDAGDLDALSDQMDALHHRCGGFMVHESLAEARAALEPPRD